MDARIDQQFARFQKTHDPRLLAAVFDATAPELWRVAAHLCRDRHDAEDAVQSAFLAAIAAKDSWDEQRPVLPWLLGLLANRVREQRRAAARVVDAARLGERAGERDPAAVAQDREFGGAFVRALAAVDEPFRSVVERHLVHGQAAVDIAQEIGVPAATVRTRLHRGLEQLRQKLPVGVVAMGVVPVVMPREVLAAMREQVVAAVPGGGVVAGAAAVGGWSALLMTKVALAVCAAFVVVGVAAWQLGGLRNSAVLDGPAGSTAAAQTSIVRSKDLVTARDVSTSSQVSGSDREPASLASLGVGTLRVLVRNADTLQPIAKVQVQAFHEDEGATAVDAPTLDGADQPTAAAGRTDEQGRVVLRLVAGRARVCVGNSLPEPSHAVVVADAETEHVHPIAAHFVADVRVVDAQGRPVAGASIYGVKNDDGYTHEPELLGRTDEEGRWRSPRTEPFLVVLAVADGQAASVAKAVQHAECVELQLGGAAVPVSGSVVDAKQRPQAGVLVAFVPKHVANAAELPLVVRTDAEGRFACSWLAAGWHHVLIAAEPGNGGAFMLGEVDIDAASRRPVELRMPLGASLRMQLNRHDGGPQVGSISLQRAGSMPRCLREWVFRGGTTHPDGSLRMRWLMPGTYYLHASAGPQPHSQVVELIDGKTVEFQHTFAPVRTLAVEVVDEHATPRADVRLHLRRSGRDFDVRSTDEYGRAQFEGVVAGEHQVWVGGVPRGLHWSQHTVSTATTARLVVPANLGTTVVRGRLVLGDAALPVGQVAMVRLGPSAFEEQVEFAAYDATTGRFVFERLPPGRFRLLALSKPGAVRIDVDVPASGTVELGDILLGTGRLVVTQHRVVPRVEAGFVALALADSDAFIHYKQTHDGGQIAVADLPAAHYCALVWGSDTLPFVTRFDCRIGEDAAVAVDRLPAVPTAFVLPSAPAIVTYQMADGTHLKESVDRAGELVRGFGPGRCRIELESFTGERLAADFTVGTEPGEPIELLPMPAPR